MADFQTSVDIANRALQHCGARRITAFTDGSKNANSVSFCYDKLREAELRRNVWTFAVRKVALRPVDNTTRVIVPPAWSNVTTYPQGFVVSNGGAVWESTAAGNIGQTPGQDASAWELYSGPKTVRPFLLSGANPFWTSTLQYQIGNLVSYLGHNFTALLANTNVAPQIGGNASWTDNGAITGTNGDINYFSGELVLGNGTNDVTTVYRSVSSNNSDIPPSANWISLGAISSILTVLYPVGAGPVNLADTRNVFLEPYGYLRDAPADPKAGNISYLGAPSGLIPDDWTWENGMFTSRIDTMVILRFVASITKVPTMDPMFCEGLGARIGLEICEDVTQSAEKLTKIEGHYKVFMAEARTVNGIEQGPTESPEDDWIVCRI